MAQKLQNDRNKLLDDMEDKEVWLKVIDYTTNISKITALL